MFVHSSQANSKSPEHFQVHGCMTHEVLQKPNYVTGLSALVKSAVLGYNQIWVTGIKCSFKKILQIHEVNDAVWCSGTCFLSFLNVLDAAINHKTWGKSSFSGFSWMWAGREICCHTSSSSWGSPPHQPVCSVCHLHHLQTENSADYDTRRRRSEGINLKVVELTGLVRGSCCVNSGTPLPLWGHTQNHSTSSSTHTALNETIPLNLCHFFRSDFGHLQCLTIIMVQHIFVCLWYIRCIWAFYHRNRYQI